jgi:Leucine-rich repeat (LRR) protein
VLDNNRISEFGAGLAPGAFPALKRLFLNHNGLVRWVAPLSGGAEMVAEGPGANEAPEEAGDVALASDEDLLGRGSSSEEESPGAGVDAGGPAAENDAARDPAAEHDAATAEGEADAEAEAASGDEGADFVEQNATDSLEAGAGDDRQSTAVEEQGAVSPADAAPPSIEDDGVEKGPAAGPPAAARAAGTGTVAGILPNLRLFSAQNNELSEFPLQLTECTKLRELLLAGNLISEVPSTVGRLRRLEILGLRKNRLQKLPPELSRAKQLVTVDLGDNPLTESPASAHSHNTAGFLAFLSALNAGLRSNAASFAGHGLGTVPLQLLAVRSLTTLNLSANALELVPRQIAQLDSLRTLDMRDNLLSDLPLDIGLCTALHTLHLDRNRFDNVPDNLCALPHVQVLTMQSNRITSLTCDLANMVGLVLLDLSHNEGLGGVAADFLRESVTRLMTYLREIQSGLVYGGVNLTRRGLNAFPIEVYAGAHAFARLTLAYNEVAEIPASIDRMVALRVLDVSHNLLAALPESLGRLTALEELHLQDNQLRALPASFEALSNLLSLSMEQNPFEAFPCPFINKWTALVDLSLDTEKLATLPEGPVHTVTELIPLEVVTQGIAKAVHYRERLKQSRATGKLDCSIMSLWFVPAAVLQMPLLTSVNFTGNALLMLPPGIANLQSLHTLGLNDNRLTLLPAALASLGKLKHLSAMDNRLQRLAPEMCRLSQLDELNVTNNPNLALPPLEVVQAGLKPTLAFLSKVAKGTSHGQVELSGMRLTSLVLPWHQLQDKLQALVLSRNEIAQLPHDTSTLTALTALWLDNNSLTSFPESMGRLHSLKSLALDNNLLTALPTCICSLSSLERLTTDNNQLRFLHPRMSELQSLTLLSAANNRLTMLPSSLALIGSLRNLALSGNPLAPLPPALRERQDIEMDVPRK